MRRVFALVIALGLVLVGGLKAEAQWSAGSYEIDQILTAQGDWSTSMDAYEGQAGAAGPSTPGTSLIQVVVKRTYSAPTMTANLTLTPKGIISGSAGTNAYAASSANFGGTAVLGNSTSGGPYSGEQAWTIANITISPLEYTLNFILYAEGRKPFMGGNGVSSATGKFTGF